MVREVIELLMALEQRRLGLRRIVTS